VFYDLGFDEAEARVLEMRAELMARCASTSEKRAGRKVRRPKARHHATGCRLMKGAWRDFSADMLLVLAGVWDYDRR